MAPFPGRILDRNAADGSISGREAPFPVPAASIGPKCNHLLRFRLNGSSPFPQGIYCGEQGEFLQLCWEGRLFVPSMRPRRGGMLRFRPNADLFSSIRILDRERADCSASGRLGPFASRRILNRKATDCSVSGRTGGFSTRILDRMGPTAPFPAEYDPPPFPEH